MSCISAWSFRQRVVRKKAKEYGTKNVVEGVYEPGQRVVVISTANGLKFSDFKTRYHEAALEGVPNPRYANKPIELPESYDAAKVIFAFFPVGL